MIREREMSSDWCRSRLESFARYFFAVLLAVFLAGIQNPAAFGQIESGAISGTVRDASGAVVAGASVTARNVATSAERKVQAGDNGQFIIPGLSPGTYEVTVTSSGFAPFKARVEASVGGRTTVDAQLSISGQVTTVEVVSAEATTVTPSHRKSPRSFPRRRSHNCQV